MSNANPTRTCPVCRQKVETKSWWALMVPRSDTFVTHLPNGVYCEGSRTDVPAEDDSDGVPVEMPDDDTSAVLTVRIQDVSTDELAAEWIARIETAEAA